jgi:hypothetical protein
MYVIPPEQSAEFVSHRSDVLEIYHLPYDSKYPVICMDEQPIQLVKETRIPLPAKPGQPESVDYEYERNGTANIFMFTEPFYKTYPKLPKSRHIWTAITLVFTSCFITVLEWLLRGLSAPQTISVELTVSDRSS